MLVDNECSANRRPDQTRDGDDAVESPGSRTELVVWRNLSDDRGWECIYTAGKETVGADKEDQRRDVGA